jgi:two-component system, NtrC family, response regulator AtoC
MHKNIKVLVVDDETIMRESLRDWLADAGYEVLTAGNGVEAVELIRSEKPGVAVIDLVLPGSDGLELLRKAKQILPAIQVIMITAYSSVNTAIAAIKEGAYDYIEKPFSPEKVELLVSKLVERQTLIDENIALRQKLEDKHYFENIVAKSARMQSIIETIKIVAKTNAPVLIAGESGTGKEIIARAIHSQSQRKNKQFVVVSCSALPESIIERELFGYEGEDAGGEQRQRKGKFEIANNSTLFLDEVGDLDHNIQVRLLRILEEKTFSRLGSTELIQTQFRLISSSTQDLKMAVEQNKVSKELYYRLSVVNIEIPPLRERKEDIPVLADFFLRKFNEENQKKIAAFSPDSNDYLLRYDWPGNIRELENAIERAVILARGELIEVSDLAQQNLYTPHRTAVSKSLRDIEKNHILNVLIEAGGNCSEAARLLGISRMTLYNKIKSFGLNMNKISNSGSN